MEDFNLPSTERVVLLEALQGAMGGAPPYFWAACQICDLKSLEELVAIALANPAVARILAASTAKMVIHWTQSNKGTLQVTTPRKAAKVSANSSPANSSPVGSTTAAKSPLNRNKTSRNLAIERDNFVCALTGSVVVDVAHIYPFCSLSSKEDNIFGARHAFWDLLKTFWPEEKVAAWQEELFPEGMHETGLEVVYNLLTLSKEAHACWNRGAFALKPVSVNDDNTTLKVQFYWQKKQVNTKADMNLLTSPLSTENLDCNEGAFDAEDSAQLFDYRRKATIKSGDIFEVTTRDAIEMPLPSFRLLELQWFLQRVVGMAGAAGPYEDWLCEDDSDDEVPGLDIAEDDSLVFSDHVLPDSPLFLTKTNLAQVESSKQYMDEVERDRGGDKHGMKGIIQP